MSALRVAVRDDSATTTAHLSSESVKVRGSSLCVYGQSAHIRWPSIGGVGRSCNCTLVKERGSCQRLNLGAQTDRQQPCSHYVFIASLGFFHLLLQLVKEVLNF